MNPLITKMKVPVEKLIKDLKIKGIEFKETDGIFDNVIFSNSEKELKIAYSCFYGFSRMGCATKENNEKKHIIEFVPITDDMFINGHMKNIIENFFKIK